MTFRFAYQQVIAGLTVLATSTYGLFTYEPIPADAPFASPIPFVGIYFFGVLFGLALILFAHFNANR